METRIRLAIEDEGLPLPVLQHPVGPYSLDLSYPAVLLAVEHNGGDHLTAARALRDLEREAYLTRRGWRIIRFGAAQVYSHPVCSQRGSGKSWSSLGAPAGCR